MREHATMIQKNRRVDSIVSIFNFTEPARRLLQQNLPNPEVRIIQKGLEAVRLGSAASEKPLIGPCNGNLTPWLGSSTARLTCGGWNRCAWASQRTTI